MAVLPRLSAARSVFRPREKKAPAATEALQTDNAQTENAAGVIPPESLTKQQIRRATSTRNTFALLTSFFLFITVVFLILVEIGSTHLRPGLTDMYFIRLDLSHIIPVSVPNAVLINSIAQTLGLHDFYQVGLWGFCEGYYNPTMVTSCTKPKLLYYFNPVEILESELLAGASIQLPAVINTVLKIIRIASHVMFGFFLTGACLSTILIFVVPFSVRSRRDACFISLFTFLNSSLIFIATVIASAMFIIFKIAVTSVDELNIQAQIGTKMFAFMWIAAVFAMLTSFIHMGFCCCCTSRKDVITGRKKVTVKTNEKTT